MGYLDRHKNIHCHEIIEHKVMQNCVDHVRCTFENLIPILNFLGLEFDCIDFEEQHVHLLLTTHASGVLGIGNVLNAQMKLDIGSESKFSTIAVL